VSRRLSAPRLISIGFATLIVVGTLLLKLPASGNEYISWTDAFFVSVSASCVTGLSTVDFPTTFTTLGQSVVMALTQIGGLGIMTLTTLAALLVGRRVGFRDLLTVREELGTIDSPRNTLRLVGQIAGITLLVELLGAILLGLGFARGGREIGEAAYQGLFHAIMAFCNAGFTSLPGGNLFPYAGNPLVVISLVSLIILGGLGFPVLINLYHYRRVWRLTVHTKLVLITTAVLIFVGVVSVAVLEWTNPDTLGGNPAGTRVFMSLFQGVTPRTAGFQTVDYAEMREPTLLVQTGLMFVGTGPASTGGGVKVTTLVLLALVMVAQVRGEEDVAVFGRQLPRQLIARAFAVLSLSALLVLAATLALMLSDGLALLPAVFEVTSAFGTVGLSLDVTSQLSAFGKLLVAAVMFLGRVGPITLILALSARQRKRSYAYPQEDIAIG
jgi:trk system potassium uptake protein